MAHETKKRKCLVYFLGLGIPMGRCSSGDEMLLSELVLLG